ncbi:MAG: hypothetical protein M5U28_41980 [Sandaracinaceae bacterium]|nr:hypothetical protein [Sandaracinaceae bacterium]
MKLPQRAHVPAAARSGWSAQRSDAALASGGCGSGGCGAGGCGSGAWGSGGCGSGGSGSMAGRDSTARGRERAGLLSFERGANRV